VRVSAGRDCVSGNFNAMVVRLVDDSTTSQPANALTSVAEPPSSGGLMGGRRGTPPHSVRWLAG